MAAGNPRSSASCSSTRTTRANPSVEWLSSVGQGQLNKVIRAARNLTWLFFNILKGQGPAAPLGDMNYVVRGVLLGSFVLAAARAECGVTALRTFIVSQDGVVYEKDLGQ